MNFKGVFINGHIDSKSLVGLVDGDMVWLNLFPSSVHHYRHSFTALEPVVSAHTSKPLHRAPEIMQALEPVVSAHTSKQLHKAPEIMQALGPVISAHIKHLKSCSLFSDCTDERRLHG